MEFSIEKYNQNHGPDGRFSSGAGGVATSAGTNPKVVHVVPGKTPPDDSFRMMHRAPQNIEGNKQISNLGDGELYPEDILGPNATRYYGMNHKDDALAARIIRRVQGNPDMKVTVYRAIADSTTAPQLHPGDWVTPSETYAREHGMSTPDGIYTIVSADIPAGQLYTDANALLEWGYDPSGGVAKFNPNHDERGRFSSGSGSGASISPTDPRIAAPLVAMANDIDLDSTWEATVSEASTNLNKAIPGGLGKGNVFGVTKFSAGAHGQDVVGYYTTSDPGTVHIMEELEFTEGAARETIYHEYGHLIDAEVFNPGAGSHFASMAAGYKDSPASGVMRAIHSTESTKLHLSYKAQGGEARWNYLTSDHEMFARAFSRYVAEKSGDRDALMAMFDRPAEELEWLNHPSEWEPISAAFDEMFAAPIEKFNPNHDERGRFSTGAGLSIHADRSNLTDAGRKIKQRADIRIGNESWGYQYYAPGSDDPFGNNLSFEEKATAYERQTLGSAQAYVDTLPVVSRMPADALTKFITEGRFKTQHEAMRSEGSFNPEYRAKVEADIFGFPQEMPVKFAPVYGYFDRPANDPLADTDDVMQYGVTKVTFKDSVRQRTTFSSDDTLRAMTLPAPAKSIDRYAINWADPTIRSREGGSLGDALREKPGFLEAQIHGGVTPRDIARIDLPEGYDQGAAKEYTDNLTQAAEKYGIPVYVGQPEVREFEKFNPNHDAKGKFSSGGGGGKNAEVAARIGPTRAGYNANVKMADYTDPAGGTHTMIFERYRPRQDSMAIGESESDISQARSVIDIAAPESYGSMMAVQWEPRGPYIIDWIGVEDEAYQRKGLATAMLEFARREAPRSEIQHSGLYTSDGEAFTDVVKYNPNHDSAGRFSSGTGVSSTWDTFKVGSNNKTGSKAAQAAFAAISKVHGIKQIKAVQVDSHTQREALSVARGAEGWYIPGTTTVNVGEHAVNPAFVTVHEFGHLMDHEVLRPGKSVSQYMDYDPDYEPVFRSLIASPTVQRIDGRNGGKRDDYLANDSEMFARAYTQWVTVRSGDKLLRKQLVNERKALPNEVWPDAEFGPIADAMDTLFATKGLLTAPVEKHNPYHGSDGRFTTGPGGTSDLATEASGFDSMSAVQGDDGAGGGVGRRTTVAEWDGGNWIGGFDAPDNREDYTFKAIAEIQGFDAKPEVASVARSHELRQAGGFVVYRGVTGNFYDGKHHSAAEHAERFRSGELFAGKGIDGSGSYFTAQKGYADAYGDGDGSIITAIIKPEARIVKSADIHKMRSDAANKYLDSHEIFYPSPMDYGIFADDGSFAAALGYDVIEGSNYVVLNRGILAVKPADNVQKFNPNHDERGRFSSGTGGGAGLIDVSTLYGGQFDMTHVTDPGIASLMWERNGIKDVYNTTQISDRHRIEDTDIAATTAAMSDPEVDAQAMVIGSPNMSYNQAEMTLLISGAEARSAIAKKGAAWVYYDAGMMEVTDYDPTVEYPISGPIEEGWGSLRPLAHEVRPSTFVRKATTPAEADATIRTMVHERAARLMSSAWNGSSHRGASLDMHDAAERTFDLKGALPPLEEHGGDRANPLTKRYADAYVQATYKRTQDFFARELPSVKTVRLYRGMNLANDDHGGGLFMPIAGTNKDGGTTVDVKDRPLASWSISSNVARQFAGGNYGPARGGYVNIQDVPVADIFSIGGAGVGAASEHEVVVLGRDNATSTLVSMGYRLIPEGQ